MKLLPVLLAICAVALANLHTLETEDRSDWLLSLVKSTGKITDDKFRANREYKFFYDGQLTSSIPTSSKLTSGTRIQSLVTVVFTDETRVLLKLSNTRFGKLNEEVPSDLRLLPFESFEEVPMESELKEKLMLTVQFRYSSGLISNIVFDGEEQPWSANIKRGVLNLIQINLNKDNRVEREISSVEIDSSVISRRSFTTIEKTLEGECEVLYTVVPKRSSEKWSFIEETLETSTDIESLSSRFFTVIKTINFEKCNKRPEVTYNHRFQQFCPSCEGRMNKQERSLVSSSVISMRVECPESLTSSCLIRKSTAESDYSFVLFGEESNVISTKVRQTLELVKSSSIETDVMEPSNTRDSDSQMLYSLDWDVMKEKFFVNGEESFDEKTPFSKLQNKIDFVESIIVKLVQYTRESVTEEAPVQFARLVKVMRMLKKDDLKEIYDKFFLSHPESFTKEEHKKIKDLILDSYALCGTSDCILMMIDSIKEKEISTTKASMVIRKLMDVRVLNSKMIRYVESICTETSLCRTSPQVKQAVMLTTGSMMRALCHSKNLDKPAFSSMLESQDIIREKMCPKSLRLDFVEKVISEFESTDKQWMKVLCLKTLSNCGLKEIIKPLEKIIRNKEVSPVLRVEAILAFNHLIDVTPETITMVLLPVYMNRLEHPSVRIASLFEIMNTLPNKIVLDQITRSLYTERNPSVATFSYTLLDTLSKSLNTCTKEMSDNIKLSMRPLRSLNFDNFVRKSYYSRMYEFISRKSNSGVSIDYTNIKTDNILPWMISSTMNLKFAGLWSPKFTTVSISQLGLSRVMNQLLRSYSHNMQSSWSDLLSKKFELPSPRFNYRKELKEMFTTLNVDSSTEFDFEPLGLIDLKFKNDEFAFLPLTRELFPSEFLSMFETGKWSVETLTKFLEHTLMGSRQTSFSFHTGMMIHEQSRKIPTTLGLPIEVSFRVPTVMQVTGSVKAELDSSRKIRLSVMDLKPSVVSKMITKVECWSPIVNSGVTVVASAKVFAPFEGSISFDSSKSPSEFKMVVSPIQTETKEIFRIESRPSTFTLVWPKFLTQWQEPELRTIRNTELHRVESHDQVYGVNKFGIKFESRGLWHKSLTSTYKSSPISLLCGPNFYSLKSSSGHEMPKEFIMTITGNMFNRHSDSIKTNFVNFFDSSSNSESLEKSLDISLSSESSEETSFESKEYNKVYTRSSPVKNDITIRLTTKGSSVKRELELLTSCLCDETMKSCKCKVDIERTPIPTEETQPWKFESEFEVVYPETPMSVSELKLSKSVMSRVMSKWGPKDSMIKKFNVKIIAEQSRLMKELNEKSLYTRMYKTHRHNHRSLFSPVAQYHQTMKYGSLDEVKFDLDYKLSHTQEEYLNSLFRSLKNMYFGKTMTSQITGKKTSNGRVVAKINIDPITHKFFNLTVQTPLEQTSIIDMPMFISWPSWMNVRKVSSPSRSWYNFVSSMFSSSKPVCQIRTDRLMTFNKVERNIPTSTCYSVLAKDCTENSKFAVLIKKQSPTTELKTLKIVSENLKLVIKSFESEPLECKINDEIKPCSEIDVQTIHGDHVSLSCRLHSTEMVECHLPEAGIKVFFDGYSTDIKMSEVYTRSVCGLCGNKKMFSKEMPMLEDYSERVEESKVSRELLERFLLKEDSETCHHEFTSQPSSFFSLIDRDNDYTFSSRRSSEIEVPELMETPIRTHRSVVRPVRKTLVIEQGSELCFSKVPVKSCPLHTHPITKSETKERVVFTCLSRNSRQAGLLEERIVRGETLMLDEMVSSFTESITVPIKCKHYNY
jgi:hypothetical protein